ncbi:PLP-dependent aminotransferase family protein [Peribacillus sp. TH16]|uniref:MocR-like pyridoxine biosynthesis transcription factor PdxR n=1 Tax=Peribacillus sp. TH16 TaxID=2798482 RepID=UPI0019114A06|nr:PLP-dependent aminotransferase family protein [Peribacillus sp. TH16]MBK5481774.1 PLP-dependent aminotransferase family protein [Peribacillus sp. TH16]
MFEITLTLEKTKKEPLYLQLYEYIKVEIQNGQINAGIKLPSKRKLAVHLGIGLNTVDAAYQQLIAEGYVESRLRKGYYVADLERILPIMEQLPVSQGMIYPQRETSKIDFNHGRVDIDSFPHSVWKKCLNNTLYHQERELFISGDSQGEVGLRTEIAAYLFQSRGVRCVPDQIIIGAGTQYLIHLLRLLLGNERIFGVEDPCFHRVREVLRLEGAHMTFIPLDESGMSVDTLKESAANVAYVTPSHQFPSGMIMPITRRVELLNWAEKNNGYIIEDDYDGEFRHAGKPIPSLQGLDINGRVIYLGTFSKSLIPTIRVGYMVLPKELAIIYHEKLKGYKQTVSRMIQETLCLFMKNGHWERHLNKMRTIYRKKNKVLLNAIEENFNDRVTVIGEKSGLHVLLKVKNSSTESELIQMAASVGVKVHPTSVYHSKKVKEPTILIGYGGLTEREIEEGIRLLKKAWL